MTTRRELFGIAAGAVVAPAIAKIDLFAPAAPLTTQAAFAAITRQTFVPTVWVKVYNQSPMLSLMMRD